MKIRNLSIVLGLGLLIASCTDKKAQEEIVQLKADMKAADSVCLADKQMLMDEITLLQMQMDSLMGPANTTKTGSTGKTTTTTTTTTTGTGGKIDVTKKSGSNTTIDVNKKEGTNTTIDVNKKGGATKEGGN